MLSRVAERVYWLARYLERSESTARLILAYNQVTLDLPKGNELGWDTLLHITASDRGFSGRYKQRGEKEIIRFLTSDGDNQASIVTSVNRLRENVRTTREVIPSEAWERVNELHHYVHGHAEQAAKRKGRYRFLRQVIAGCQQLTGLLEGSLSHDQSHAFTCLGRNLERADMTSRILDVGAGALLIRRDAPLPFDALLWMNVLDSLNAVEAYRLRISPRITAAGVAGFLLQDTRFPRAILCCVEAADRCMEALPRSTAVHESLTELAARIRTADATALARTGMHEYIDQIQCDLIDLGDRIRRTWFAPDPTPAPGSQHAAGAMGQTQRQTAN